MELLKRDIGISITLKDEPTLLLAAARKEAIEMYLKANRNDLSDKE